jgi:hypothetical protein
MHGYTQHLDTSATLVVQGVVRQMGFAPIRTVAPEKDRPVEPKSTAYTDFATAALLFVSSHGGSLSSGPPFFFPRFTCNHLDIGASQEVRPHRVVVLRSIRVYHKPVDTDTMDSIIV